MKAGMKPFSKESVFYATLLATSLAVRGSKKKSLSKSGAVAGFVVGFLSIACGWRGLLVIVFYQLGSWATKFKKHIKERIDATATVASSRGASQVLGCSLIAVVCAVAHAVLCGEEQRVDFRSTPQASKFACGIIAHYATCLGDTLASELGILSSEQPRLLILPWKRVPSGTNGGVTILGTLWSIIGGVIIGFATAFLDTGTVIDIYYYYRMICFGSVCGFLGSSIDSFLGATLQVTYFDTNQKLVCDSSSSKSDNLKHISGMDILTNVQVNLISVLFTTVIGAFVIGPYMFATQ